MSFTVLMEDLKRYIYNVGIGPQANQFITSTKEVASYAIRKCMDPQNIHIYIENTEDAKIHIK